MTELTLATFFVFNGQHPTELQLETLRIGATRMLDRKALPGPPRPAFWSKTVSAVSGALTQALDVRLTDVLVRGWNTCHRLIEAAAQSRTAPGKAFEVTLGHHTIASSHEPHVEVLVGGVKMADVPFEVDLELEIESAILTIQDGSIREISMGRCTGTGTLKCCGAVLVDKTTAAIALPGRIKLSHGIRINPAL